MDTPGSLAATNSQLHYTQQISTTAGFGQCQKFATLAAGWPHYDQLDLVIKHAAPLAHYVTANHRTWWKL